MKQRTIVGIAASAPVVALAIPSLGNAFAQTQPQPGWGPVSMMGGGYGPGGMLGGYGPGAMMGGYGQGGMMGWSTTSAQAQPLTSLDDATKAFQRYIDATNNSSLALDEVMQFQWNYYAIVKDTSTGEGAFELIANPRTGAVFPEMGPNMMWNTKYGHMAGFGMMGGRFQRPTGDPLISAEGAQELAQQWLDQNQPGAGTEPPDTFPGYYTVHITNDGQISGMLSVNAYTGAVWYHTWHGAFVASSQA